MRLVHLTIGAAYRVAPTGTLGLDARVPVPDLFWRVGMCRRQAVDEFKMIFRLLTKCCAQLTTRKEIIHIRRYKRDLRRVYRFYASIGAKSRVKASGSNSCLVIL